MKMIINNLMSALAVFTYTLTGDKTAAIARWMETCVVRCQKKSGDCMFA